MIRGKTKAIEVLGHGDDGGEGVVPCEGGRGEEGFDYLTGVGDRMVRGEVEVTGQVGEEGGGDVGVRVGVVGNVGEGDGVWEVR